MFKALNERVIATPHTLEENTTSSGIILVEKDHACIRYKVCFTNELTKDLQDKIVYAEARFKNHQLPDNGANGETYVVIPLTDILAVKA